MGDRLVAMAPQNDRLDDGWKLHPEQKQTSNCEKKPRHKLARIPVLFAEREAQVKVVANPARGAE